MKTRPETRTRQVPHTIDGKTSMVTEPYTVHVPVPPRDWDRILLNSVTFAVSVMMIASIVWTTASVGDLLAVVVAAAAAYAAAIVFDLAWITCLALEWLARHDTDKARLPRTAGHIALGMAMAAVGAHGWLAGTWQIGIVSAMVSALVKGVWTVVLRHHATPLDDRTRQWLVQQQAEAGAQLALAAVRRQVARVDGQLAAQRAALALPAADTDAPVQDTDTRTGPDNRAAGTVRAAVRAASATMPDATHDDIAGQLADAGIPVSADTVRDVLGHADTGTADTPDSRSGGVVRPIRPVRTQPVRRQADTIADTVRTALASGITDEDAVLSVVRGVHGEDVKRDTVARTRRRIERPA